RGLQRPWLHARPHRRPADGRDARPRPRRHDGRRPARHRPLRPRRSPRRDAHVRLISPEAHAVLAYVDPRELVDLAGELIRIPSLKTEEPPVALFLENFFRARDYDVQLQETEAGRLQTTPTLRGPGGGASLMLNGHTDINALPRRWTRDPWT